MSMGVPAGVGGRTSKDRVIAPLAFLVVVLVGWHVATTSGWVSSLLFPEPLAVARSTYELFATGLIWEHLFATLYETLAGFAAAATVSIGLALAAGWSPLLRHVIQPYAVVLQVMPMLALAPIILSIFGFGFESKIVVAGLIAFFPIFVNTLTGLLIPDPEEEELFRSVGAGRGKTFLYVLLPTAAPLIFAGLRIGMILALAGAIVAEFVSAQVGLGLMVQTFSYQLNLDDAFAVIFILTAIGLALYGLIALLDRLVVFWRRERGLNWHSERRARRYRRRFAQSITKFDADTVGPTSEVGSEQDTTWR